MWFSKIVHWIVISIVTLLLFVIWIPAYLTLNRKIMTYIGSVCVVTNLFVIEFLFGLKRNVTGIENIPDDNCIIACKHQSAWETLYLPLLFPLLTVILKKELLKVPFMGNYLYHAGMIFVDRSDALGSMKAILKGTKRSFEEGRRLVIFPEGTRVPYGQRVPIKGGIIAIAKHFPDTMIVPVSLDSGKCWAKGGKIIRNSVVNVHFGKPIKYVDFKEDIALKIEEEINAL